MNLTTAFRGFGLASIFACLELAFAQPYVISTVAGGVPPPTPVAAVNASLSLPSGVAVDNSGNVYFTSNNAVFKIDTSGSLTRVAGTSRAGYSGDGGPAAGAQLNGPYGVAVDASGNLYIADSANNRIRKVASSGIITTVAGNGIAGYSGDGLPAISTQLNFPLGIAVDSSGKLYIADSYNQRIRMVAATGTITTIAGDGTCCYSGDNMPAVKAQLHQPEGLAVDGAGNVYIADLGNNRIRKVTTAGVITTVAGTGAPGTAGENVPATSAQLQVAWTVASDASGNLYISDGDRIRRVSAPGTIITVAGSLTAGFAGDGGAATKAQFDQPFGVAVDPLGNLYIADTGNNRIRKIAVNGNIATIAGDGTHNYSGDGGQAASAQMYNPQAVTLGAAGSFYVSDYARVRRIASNGVITTVGGAGQPMQPEGLAFDAASGNLYIADAAANRVLSLGPTGAFTTFVTSSELRDPEGLAVDSAGNLYIADSGNSRVRKVTPAGAITTIAGNGTLGYSGDNGPATSAQLAFPRGVAVDSSGTLYVADFGNSRIRKVSASGVITTVAGSGMEDSSGDGGPATSAGISPQGVAVDASGNIFIADLNNLVWRVSTSGTIARIAGTGTFGYSGDGGSSAVAQLTDARSIAVDPAGNLYIADTSNDAIRLMRPVAALLIISTPSPLPPSPVSASYSQQLMATGGTGPYTWSLVSGALPAGLSLSVSGVISGTPTSAGVSSFIVQVADSASAIATQAYTLTVTVPAITTISQLLQGTVGLGYSQTLSVNGGASPYAWTLTAGSLPSGVTLSTAGVITGTPTSAGTFNFTVKVTDSASNVATQSFTLIVIAAPALVRTGVLAHIAAGGSWTTTIFLANTSSNQVAVSLLLHADDGSALNLPMTVTQLGITQAVTATSLNAVISPNATLVVDTGQQVAALVSGWVDVLSSGPLNGFAIFRTTASDTASEGTSPLQTQFENRIAVPYDNRNGFVTAVALANLSNSPATITATTWDSTGTQLGGVQTFTLPASGHAAFLLTTQFTATAGVQGIVQFQSSAGNLGGVGLRASPQGTFTSVPVIEP